MDDLISREAAIDALDQVAQMFPYRIPGNAKTYRQYNEAWNDAIDAAETAIEALPSAQRGWIPCKTALPEHDGEYLVTINALTIDQAVYAEIDIARYTGGKWRKGFPVVAWMPLPEPWEGGQDEQN